MSKRNNRAKAPIRRKHQRRNQIFGVVIAIGLLAGFAFLLFSQGGNGKPYFAKLDALAKSLPHESPLGCVHWSGAWKYTEDQYSGVQFHAADFAAPGCSQSIEIDFIAISTGITREASALSIMQKEWNAMVVWDFLLTKGLPVKPVDAELITLVDGLAFLHLTVDQQDEMVARYTPPHFQWDGISMPQCREIRAVNELSLNFQINGGGIPQLVASACGN